jgi:preprotein translocase subunit Sec63
VSDPFDALGLASDASLDDVRSARRRLALRAHPDQGGSQQQMVELNQAFDAAVKAVRARSIITPNSYALAATSAPTHRP